jgi:hypothetical protein
MRIWNSTADITLPVPPPGWQLLAWQGMALVVPVAWNLVRHSGDDDGGAMGLSSLRAMALEIRWRSFRFRSARRYEQRLVKRLAGRQMNVRLLPAQEDGLIRTRIDLDDGVVVLVRSRRRVYEFSWPGAAEHVEQVAASVRDYSGARAWPWAAYGAAGVVPRRLKPRKLDLKPGAVRLDFARGGRRVVVGSWSMAERLLGAGTLEAFAQARIPLVKNNPHGTWYQAGSGWLYMVTFRTPLFRRRRANVLYLEHHPEANTIEWLQRSAPRRDAGALLIGLPGA